MTLKDDIIAAVEAGTVLDLAGDSQPDRAEMESWGPGRTIEATLIRDVLLGREAPNADPHGIQLRGVRIKGPLDLYNIQSDLDLMLSTCIIEGGVILRRARLRMVSFIGCVIRPGIHGACLDGQQLVAATLDFELTTFDGRVGAGCAIDLWGAEVKGPFNLSGAQLYGHDRDGDGLMGDGLTVDGNMFLCASGRSVFTADGAIRLPGAHIHGTLDLSGGLLKGHDDDGDSLIGDGLTVEGDLFLRRNDESPFTAAGAIRLQRAHIHGALDLSGAQLKGYDHDGDSLISDGLTVGGGMFLRRPKGRPPFTAAGAIRLSRAHIYRQLDLSEAQLRGCDASGNSLFGDGLTVDGDMYLSIRDESPPTTASANGDSPLGDGLTVDGNDMSRESIGRSPFTAAGAIRLPRAHIHGQLDLSGAQLTGFNRDGNSLIGDGLTIDSDMLLRTKGDSAFTAAGAIQLVRAHVLGQLAVSLSSVENHGGVLVLSLAGVSIGELSLDLPEKLSTGVRVDLKDASYAGLSRLDNLEQWLMLLRRHAPYTPKAYQQLAMVHRAAGHERDARRILIAQQEDRRRRVVQPDEKMDRTQNDRHQPAAGPDKKTSRRKRVRLWARRTGLWLQKVTIGYGYRTWPAFVGVLVLAGLGAGFGILAGHTHAGKQFAAYRPASAVRKVNQNCSIVEQASLGVRVPFLSNLGAGDCVLNTASVPGGVYSVAIWTDQALAWAAATLAVAGYTGLVRKT